MTDHVLVTRQGAVTEIRLARPDKKNALTNAMYATLADALVDAAGDESVCVVTVSGTEGTFTAGNDLRDFQQNPPLGMDKPVYRFISAIASFPKILIAGVAGPAIGIGTTMLLHCDIVVAAPTAVFSMPFVDLGLVPEAASSLLFPRLVGPQRAAWHLILGEPFDAQTALRYGVASEIVDEPELDARIHELASRIAAKPPEAVRLAKRLIRDGGQSVSARYAEEGRLFADRLQSAEAAEAFTAFFEKRAPDFSRF